MTYVHVDNDQSGRDQAAALACALGTAGAAKVILVTYEDCEPKEDVADWLAHGHDLEALLERCETAETDRAQVANGLRVGCQTKIGPTVDAAIQGVKTDFELTAGGAVAKTEGNIRRALAKAGIRLRYDQFARQRLIDGLPSYGPDLSDAAIDAMWITFEREHRVRFTREHFNAVIRVEAHAQHLPSGARIPRHA